MKELYEYNEALKLFIKFLKDKNIDPKKALTSSIQANLGYLLEFLDSHGIYCLIDNYSIIIYTDGTNDKAKRYVAMTNKVYIINERNTQKYNDVIVNYAIAIKRAFEYLNYPF